MRMSKKGVSLLLCLGLVASMSVCAITASAEDFPCDTQGTIYGLDDNEYGSFNVDTGFTIKKDGYYTFAISTYGGAEWHEVAHDDITAGKSIDSMPEYLETSFVHYSSGDIVPDSKYFGNPVIMFYKESEDADYQMYALDVDSVMIADTGDLFTVSTVEESPTGVTFSVSFAVLEGDNIADFSVYLDGEYYGETDEIIREPASGETFEFPVYSNGTYEFKATSDLGVDCSKEFVVNCIDYNAVDGEDEPDSVGPQLSYSLSTNETGLEADATVTITVTSDRACTITSDGFDAAVDVTSASYDVKGNGVFTFLASDSETMDTSSIEVTVTNFGDGTLPDYINGDDYSDLVNGNDNPIEDGNHGSYWEDAANTMYDEDGSLLKNLADDPTGEDAKNPSDSMSKLPQTGITSWVVALGCSIAAVAFGVFLIFRKGIIAKLCKRGGSR